MTNLQAQLVFAFLSDLSFARSHGTARQPIESVAVGMGIMPATLHSVLDDFDAATFRRAFRLDGSTSVADLLADAADIARRVTNRAPDE